MDALKALGVIAAEFGLSILLSSSFVVGWRLTLVDREGVLATGESRDMDELCRTASQWLRDVYSLEVARQA